MSAAQGEGATRAGNSRSLLAGLGLAVLALSSAALFVKLAAPIPPDVVACVRVLVTAIGMALLGVVGSPGAELAGRGIVDAVRVLAGHRRELVWTIVAGLCLAAHFGAWITSLTLTSVVRSVTLVTTQPLVAGLLARALGDQAPPRLYLGTLVALTGTTIMIASPEAFQGGSWVGDLLALSGAVTAASYLAIGRHVHAKLGDELPLRGYFVLVNLVAAIGLAGLVMISGSDWTAPDARVEDWAAVIVMALVPGVIGHGLLNWAVRRAPVHVVALAVLLEPVGAVLLAWVVLGEVVGWREALGAAVLLLGVAFGAPRKG